MVTETSKDCILYLDDEQSNLDLFWAIFNTKYEVFITPSIPEAEEILKNIPIKVLVSDFFMPNESGIEFIDRIHPIYPDIVKILFTAYGNEDLLKEAINKGIVFRYHEKPMNRAEISNSLDAAIKTYDLQFNNRMLLNELFIKNIELSDAFEAIKFNEEKFRNIFNQSHDGMYLINQEHEITDANHAFYSMFTHGYEQGSLIELTSYIRDNYHELIELPMQQVKGIVSENYEISSSGNKNKRYFELSSSYLEQNKPGIIVCIVREVTERKAYDKKLLDAILNTQEESRAKYARELHDGLGPILSTLRMHLEWIAGPEQQANKENILKHAVLSVNEAIKYIKEIAFNLSPHILQQFGINYALKAFIEKNKEIADIDIKMSSTLTEKLDPDIEINLYRIVLECITNSLKHAQAKKISIKIKKHYNSVYLGYSDNGVGFDIKKHLSDNSSKGMGLYNIQNRIRHLNGKFKVSSGVGHGFILGITVNF